MLNEDAAQRKRPHISEKAREYGADFVGEARLRG
jgi:hypothetical protein